MQSSKSRRGGTCMRMGWMMLQPILPPDCVHQAAALMQHLPHCRTQSLVAKTGSDRRAVQRFREAAQRRRCVFGMVCCVHETCAQSRRHSRQPFVSTAGVLRAQPVERRGVWPQVEVRYSACGAFHPLRVPTISGESERRQRSRPARPRQSDHCETMKSFCCRMPPIAR